MPVFEHLMPAKHRSNHGCWTCRLRKKACSFDGRRANPGSQRPDCEVCRRLEITCYNGDEKPEWMSTEPQRKAMMQKITAEIKDKASRRRDRKYLEMLEVGTSRVNLNGDEKRRTAPAEANLSGNSDTEQSSGHDIGSTPASSNTSDSSPQSASTFPPVLSQAPAPHDSPDPSSVHLIMIYLDYIFPYLFPYYRPPILAGGRGWILELMQGSSKSIYHTAVSLASYFSSILLSGGGSQHAPCTEAMVSQLQKQLQMGLSELQKEMTAVNAAGSRVAPSDRLLVMTSILTMVIFEVATSCGENWKIHLDAAIAIFCQIAPEPSKWAATLDSLKHSEGPEMPADLQAPWSTHQAAFRFFTANLLYFDIMSSISLERPPKLWMYQGDIIPGCAIKTSWLDGRTVGPLFISDFIGLHNGVIQMLSDVSTLEAWKKDQRRAGSLSMNELVSRGRILEDAIKSAISLTEQKIHNPDANIPGPMGNVVEDPLQYLLPESPEVTQGSPVHNLVWLRATQAYLYLVVSGWQPSSPEIRAAATIVTNLLVDVTRGSCLRTMAFPFCIAGILAPPEEEQKFRAMVERLGPLRVFGTVKDAMQVVEAVWTQRDKMDETWDVAKCLGILGHRVLLI